MTNFEAVLPRNDKIRYFLSQKCCLRAVSQQHAQFALQANPAVYPALIWYVYVCNLEKSKIKLGILFLETRNISFCKTSKIIHFTNLGISFHPSVVRDVAMKSRSLKFDKDRDENGNQKTIQLHYFILFIKLLG